MNKITLVNLKIGNIRQIAPSISHCIQNAVEVLSDLCYFKCNWKGKGKFVPVNVTIKWQSSYTHS